jgi:hypothetical protein
MGRRDASAIDREIVDVATRLDRLLDELNAAAVALTEILRRPDASPAGEGDERLVPS